MCEINDELTKTISSRIDVVKGNIEKTCEECGRDIKDVTLIGVSKVFPVSYAIAAYNAGLINLAENKVQDFCKKYDYMLLKNIIPSWHLIGTLQKNKVKYIIGKTKLIHSVDSLSLAEEISKRSINNSVVTDILLQVNISGEETKHGFKELELKEVLDDINNLKGISIRGLMTMAPAVADEKVRRTVFEKTYKFYTSLRNEVKDIKVWDTLSMGMSRDYREAILEGSTMVRIGTDIFGDRKVILNE